MLKEIGGNMFDEIEKEYRKGVQERRYLTYYVRRAIPITLIAIVLSLVFRKLYLVIYILTIMVLIGLAVVFFVRDVQAMDETPKAIRRKKDVKARLKNYFEVDNVRRVDGLVGVLRQHGVTTQEDLKIALDYYESQLPVATKPNLVNWILTTLVAVASIAIVTYDEATSTIDVRKFLSIFVSALVVAVMCVTPVLVFKVARYSMTRFRNRVDTILIEDLAYIYINFEKYRGKLKNDEQ